MLFPFKNLLQDFSRLLFPHFCVACGCDLKDRDAVICYHCQLDLPFTNFFSLPNNPVEKSFYGRVNLQAAGSAFYFTKDSLIQILLSELKYKQNITVGYYLGRLICKGIQSVWHKPISENAMIRKVFSSSQTLQDRLHRWENMEGIFAVKNRDQLTNKHLLLVDDVTTTGASLEALGSALETENGVTLSVATAAYTI